MVVPSFRKPQTAPAIPCKYGTHRTCDTRPDYIVLAPPAGCVLSIQCPYTPPAQRNGAVMRRLAITLHALAPLLAASALMGQQLVPDTVYSRLIAEYTTDTLFLPQSAASVPAHPTVPSPL